MSFLVTINEFEGPLDLMLHLVRENELDLFNLNISELTSQYLNYILAMQDLRLEIESEYLVQLSTLIEYKSKKLLPKAEVIIEGEYEEDPALALANRLIMYQKYKDVCEELEEQYISRQEQLSKTISEISEDIKDNQEDYFSIQGTPYDLMKAMNRALRRIKLIQPLETKKTTREISVDDRVLQIKAKLINLPDKFSFDDLIVDCEEITLYIVTFLAILDMAKHQFLLFTIDSEERIWFTKRSV